jgi:hypothetical protein
VIQGEQCGAHEASVRPGLVIGLCGLRMLSDLWRFVAMRECMLSDQNPYTPPNTLEPPSNSQARRRRAKKWAGRMLVVTGAPALVIVFPVLLHEFGVPIPQAFRLFKPQTPWFIMYPEMIACPFACFGWIASWILPIKKQTGS